MAAHCISIEGSIKIWLVIWSCWDFEKLFCVICAFMCYFGYAWVYFKFFLFLAEESLQKKLSRIREELLRTEQSKRSSEQHLSRSQVLFFFNSVFRAWICLNHARL